MKTWTNAVVSSSTAITTWNYNSHRGWLDSKDYPNADDGQPPDPLGSTGPSYIYTSGGRLKTRTWRRIGTGGQRVVTTYKYGFELSGDNKHGDLAEITYSNDPTGTPSITYTYDRRGRQKTVTRAGATTTLAYNDANQLLTESYSGGTLDGVIVTASYDNPLRRSSLTAARSAATLLDHRYAYDTASRLEIVTDNSGSTAYSATYSYVPNSPLVAQTLFKEAANVRMSTTKDYDRLNRLLRINSVNQQQTSLSSHDYSYNAAGQRIRALLNDGSYWLYSYDRLGQVKSAIRYWSDGTPVAGQQFIYAHDDIGNRTKTWAGGDENGKGERPGNVRLSPF